MHDDPATTPPPQVTNLDDAHVERDLPASARPRPVGDDRSPNAWVCPFLRSIGDDDRLVPPIEAPDVANRCAALREPVPQSLRQQELVCLTSGHINCPRYLRGSLLPTEPLERIPKAQVVTPAIAGSVAVLIVAFLLSIGFVVANGGLTLTATVVGPTVSPSGNVLAAEETAAPTATPVPVVTPETTPGSSPTAAPTASPDQTPVPTPTASPVATPVPTKAPTSTLPPGATASRMKLLTACPDKPNCYIYRIRSGDNLYSIANYFGVAFKTIKAWNAWTDSGLKVGRELRIPPPTN